jgi:hypothetical protein
MRAIAGLLEYQVEGRVLRNGQSNHVHQQGLLDGNARQESPHIDGFLGNKVQRTLVEEWGDGSEDPGCIRGRM